MQSFGGDETISNPRAESNQLSQAVVLDLELARLHRGERKTIEVRLLGVRLKQGLTAPLGALLKHHQRREESASHSGGNGLPHGVGKRTRRERQHEATGQNNQIEPGVAA